ncbi:hypothetical protein NE237_016255 [Protea cynaroides]|uniref:Uncharacterized protein n=1 Tax=Protea cynaroides TaxID=273540 RepID=A0A9Q0QRZ8_9MAGN|nr:hypothetical protein NE237_016255 [Protea cynaroides]
MATTWIVVTSTHHRTVSRTATHEICIDFFSSDLLLLSPSFSNHRFVITHLTCNQRLGNILRLEHSFSKNTHTTKDISANKKKLPPMVMVMYSHMKNIDMMLLMTRFTVTPILMPCALDLKENIFELNECRRLQGRHVEGMVWTNEELFPYTLAVAPFRSLHDIIVALRWDPYGFFEVSESQQSFLFGIRYFVQHSFGIAKTTLHNEPTWREKAKLETYPSKIPPLMKTLGKDVKDVKKPTSATSIVNSRARA